MKIYTDGACTVGENGGWAFVTTSGFKSCGGARGTTNNEMELYAIYSALFHAKQINADEVHIYTDSAYCIGVFTQWASTWKANGWKKKGGIKNLDIIRFTYALLEELSNVSFHKVKGHSGNPYNESADKLAVQAKHKIDSDDFQESGFFLVKDEDGEVTQIIFTF